MKRTIKELLIALAIPLAVGGLAALLSGGMKDFQTMNQPPLSPPGWLFPIVWTILYLLMGYASYRVYTAEADQGAKRRALILYAIQLLLNLLWPILFFRFHPKRRLGLKSAACQTAHRESGAYKKRHRLFVFQCIPPLNSRRTSSPRSGPHRDLSVIPLCS